ncbi:MAG: InlB B-repeat-containing protein, partial [Kosmotogaceae bacterium]
MKRKIISTKALIIMAVVILFISSCVPKVGTYSLEINSEPGKVNIFIANSPEELTKLSEDEEIVLETPISKSFNFGEEIIIKVIDEQPDQDTEVLSVFSSWSDGSKENPRTITITNDKVLTAKTKTTVKIKVSSIPANLVKFDDSGWYEKGSEINLTAPEVNGYQFLHWSIDGETITDNPLNFTVEEPTKIEAKYIELLDYSLTVSTQEGLEVSIDENTGLSPLTISVQENTEHTIEMITPQETDENSWVDGIDTKYSFDSWNDDSVENPRTVIVNNDLELVARVNKDYKVEIITEPHGLGEIEGSGWYKEDYSLSLNPINIEGYDFSHWKINGEVINETSLELPVNEPKKV